MDAADLSRAISAATAISVSNGLAVDDVHVVQNSNKVSLHLAPCGLFARVAMSGQHVAELEIEIASRLTQVGAPVAQLDDRISAQPCEVDGFALTFWRFLEASAPASYNPEATSAALARLHSGMRSVEVDVPHFTDRVAEAQALVESAELTPILTADERQLLAGRLTSIRDRIERRGVPEQLLHGEPHLGNMVTTADGPRFVDLETCCWGPVEFDLAHVPRDVAAHYPNIDHALLEDCRELVLAMVAAWRADRDDRFPSRERELRRFLTALSVGPPWPTLGDESPDQR